MVKEHPLKELVRLQKKGITKGICSICSSHPYVIEAGIEKGVSEGSYVLIEATANQVNQFGGYTGMKPRDFSDYVKGIAQKKGLHREKLILGGDHLGPLVWREDNEKAAMDKATELIIQYVKAGFSKIHIDTSMRLASDPHDRKLDNEIIAMRSARLYEAAEKAFKEIAGSADYPPVYVIGSEVPIPGGTQTDEGIRVTEAADLKAALDCFRKAFKQKGAVGDLQNVIGVVVQPGVEFGEGSIHEYCSEAAKELKDFIKKEPNLVYEGHSTDYQRESHLKQMAEDGIAIQKVGPALTFALREGLIALECIEKVLFDDNADMQPSEFSKVLDSTMVKNPVFWQSYYHGSKGAMKISRKFSLSDRCRYYLQDKEVADSIKRLLKNLGSADIPLTLISQYLPAQYIKVRQGTLSKNAEALLKDKIRNVMDLYPQLTY